MAETIKASRKVVAEQEFNPQLLGPYTQLGQAPNATRARFSDLQRVIHNLTVFSSTTFIVSISWWTFVSAQTRLSRAQTERQCGWTCNAWIGIFPCFDQVRNASLYVISSCDRLRR